MGIREVKFMNAKTKANISELLVIMGTILFVGGAMSYLRGELSAEQISGIGALALIYDFFTKNRVKTALRGAGDILFRKWKWCVE